MPNSTVTAYNKAVIATVTAAELMKVEDVEDPEDGSQNSAETAPLTPEDAKKRLQMAEYLKKQGGSLIDNETCPDCGSVLGLIPKGSRKFKVCKEQFKDDPGCYWVKEVFPPQPETPITVEMLLEDEDREIEEERQAEVNAKAKAAKGGEAPQITYHADRWDD